MLHRRTSRPKGNGQMELQNAIAMVKAAGFRVTRPGRPKIAKDQRFPTFVARFKNGEVVRMTTFTALGKLDRARGERLAKAALGVRAETRGAPALVFTTFERSWFELDGKRLREAA